MRSDRCSLRSAAIRPVLHESGAERDPRVLATRREIVEGMYNTVEGMYDYDDDE